MPSGASTLLRTPWYWPRMTRTLPTCATSAGCRYWLWAGDNSKAGSEWPFFVAGRRDAETWVFKVVKREKVRIGLGEVEAVLVARQPLPDKKDQTLEVWLAPQHEWYPVKLRFADGDKEQVEQTLISLTKR